MVVMENHEWFDDGIEKILFVSHTNLRKIVLKDPNQDSICIGKKDVIALAKEFNLLVFEKESRL